MIVLSYKSLERNQPEVQSAVDFPGGSGSGTRRFVFWDLGTTPVFDIYPATWLYRCKPFEKKQSGGDNIVSRTVAGTHYWTGLQWGNFNPDGGAFQATLPGNGIFLSAGGGSATHRYSMWQPYPSGAGGAPNSDFQFQEVSAFQNDETNSNGATVRWGQPTATIAIAENLGGDHYRHRFYYDALDSTSKLIDVDVTGQSGWTSNYPPPHPCIAMGQSTWNTYTDNHEEFCGWMWGVMWFQAILNLSDAVALSALETNAAVLAYCVSHGISAPWFLSVNPTPNLGSYVFPDYSGRNNHGLWVDGGVQGNRPSLRLR